MYYSIVRYF